MVSSPERVKVQLENTAFITAFGALKSIMLEPVVLKPQRMKSNVHVEKSSTERAGDPWKFIPEITLDPAPEYVNVPVTITDSDKLAVV